MAGIDHGFDDPQAHRGAAVSLPVLALTVLRSR